nr:ATP-dependent helicase [uncultured Acetatifactor sp.]
MMTYEEFQETFHIRLNRQQAQAVRAVDGATLLLAVPGSGKTTVLVARLGYLIHGAGIAPENILTLTYTVVATRDMAARFASFFGEELSARMEFRTINGICAKVIQYYGQLIGKRSFALVTEEKAILSLLSAIYQRVEGGYATEGDLKGIRLLITYIKNMMLDEAGIRELEKASEYRILDIYRAYCAELRAQGWMDYDDQMIYAYTILRKSPETFQYFRRRYTHICVDEAQDTSRIQHAIIRLLGGGSPEVSPGSNPQSPGRQENLFLVGDEDQSIYGFRAAYPQALLAFEKEHPGAKVLLMEENFRSNAKIVEAADAFIRKNLLRHEKHMRAAREPGDDIREIGLKSRSAQYRYLAKVAKDCRVQTAVLYRDNESALPLVDLLEREGIPYRIRNAELTFFTHRVVQDVRDIIRFAESPGDTELFLRIYYKISTYLSKQSALHICDISRERGTEVLDAALRWGNLPEKTQYSCKTVRTQLRGLLTLQAEAALERILQDLGYREYLRRAGMSESKFFILKAIARNEPSPGKLVERLDALRGIIEEKPFDADCQFLLSTIHASKGLEYHRVYLMDVADGIFPESVPEAWPAAQGAGAGDRGDGLPAGRLGAWDGRAVGSRGKPESGNRAGRLAEERGADEKALEAYEEERRLFYVGITRAKDELHIFGINQKSTFRQELFAQAKYQKFHAAIGEGLIVRHRKFGEGVVVEAGEKQVVILFGNRQRKMDLRTLYENDLLVL